MEWEKILKHGYISKDYHRQLIGKYKENFCDYYKDLFVDKSQLYRAISKLTILYIEKNKMNKKIEQQFKKYDENVLFIILI